jgi:outer membrane protein OmpA-like peptidoglycan-associated protein
VSSGGGKRKLLVVAAVWLVLLGLAAVVYKYVFAPRKKEEVVQQTSSDPRVKHRLALALDSFSGYCVLRSDDFHRELAVRGIGLDLVDDKADYAARIESLASGRTPLAVFTIDALIKASATRGELPGTIVMLIDETTGADAMVAYKQAVPNLDALNRPEARIVVTRDSPSETLARVVMARFKLPALGQDPWIDAAGAADVYRQFREASSGEPRAYVLWEPYVSKVLEDAGTHVLVDSSKFRGYIVDVLVVQRDFLVAHEDQVRAVVETYLKTAYALQQGAGGMEGVVSADSEKAGEPLTEEQARRLVAGIGWKNTQQNYAHFGVGDATAAVQSLDQMIHNITDVLEKTGAVDADPTDGQPNRLYYRRVLEGLQAANFHPSLDYNPGEETPTGPREPGPLTDAQWESLAPVGTLEVESLAFSRASARLTERSQAELAELAETLATFPQYYLLVRGHVRAEGDPEANRALAQERAQAAADFLRQAGVSADRMRAESTPPSTSGGEAQSVSFVLGQLPY